MYVAAWPDVGVTLFDRGMTVLKVVFVLALLVVLSLSHRYVDRMIADRLKGHPPESALSLAEDHHHAQLYKALRQKGILRAVGSHTPNCDSLLPVNSHRCVASAACLKRLADHCARLIADHAELAGLIGFTQQIIDRLVDESPSKCDLSRQHEAASQLTASSS